MSADEVADAGPWTWPNLVTIVRLLLLPVFLWLLFSTGHRALAAWLLAALGATDWLDGYLARRLDQVSNVGKVLDPVADRLLVMVGLLAVAGAFGLVLAWIVLLGYVKPALAALRVGRQGRKTL